MTNQDDLITFSIRIGETEKSILGSLANLMNTKPATLAREYVIEGIRRDTDPEQIARTLDEQKDKLVAEAMKIREELPDFFNNPH